MAVIQVTVFWVGTPCSDVTGYRFGGPYYLHIHPENLLFETW